MKKLSILFSFILSVIFIQACKDKDPDTSPEPRGGKIKLQMAYEFRGAPLKFEELIYQTAAGDSVQIDLLQHYLSNVWIHEKSKGWISLDITKLVRYNQPSTWLMEKKDLPFGEYDSLKFYIGLDSVTNHDITRWGELDPGAGMIWTWNTGYIFYMFEGKYKSANNATIGFAYHIGGDDYLMTYQEAISDPKTLSINQTEQTVLLTIDLAEIFSTPNEIRLDNVPKVSHTFDQPALTKLLKENLQDACRVN